MEVFVMFESSYVIVVLIIVEISKLLYTDCYSYKKKLAQV